MNLVTELLIILAGIGYTVWWDVLRVLKEAKNRRAGCFRRLTLHSKIALSATAVCLIAGTGLILLFEYHNPLTMGDASFPEKLQIAFFQSVTLRTAGFATVPQENLTNSSAIVCLLLMFIGGSPVGTAGGIKTVTFVVLFASMMATIRNRQEVVLFHRNIPKTAVNKAAAVTCMSFAILFLSTVLLAAVTEGDMLDIVYETVSATATVGLTRNLTASLGTAGKLILIATMYLGRISPISFAIAFVTAKDNQNIIKNPTEEIHVG